jgi:hypothetical protein
VVRISIAESCMRCQSYCLVSTMLEQTTFFMEPLKYKTIGLRSGDRGGHGTGHLEQRPIQRPGHWLPVHSRTARLKCAEAPSCKSNVRRRVRNETLLNNRGKFLWTNRGYGGLISFPGNVQGSVR